MGQFGETVDNKDLEGDYSKAAADERQRREHEMFKKKVDQYGLDSDQAQAQLTGMGRTYINPGAADYGGAADMADWYKQNAREHMGDNAGARESAQRGLDAAYAGMKGGASQAQENYYLSNKEAGVRGQQLEVLNLQGAAARGNAPSVAAAQTKLGQQDVLSNHFSQAGGTRTLGGMTGAQVGGAASAGRAAGDIGFQGGMARGQEIAGELGQYGKTSGQVAGQDLTRLGTSNQMGQFNASQGNDWQLGNANLAAGYGGLMNQQDSLGQRWFAESMKPGDIQFGLDQEAAGWQAGQSAEQAALALEQARDRKNFMGSVAGGIAQAGLTAIGSLAGPAGTALGGMAGSAIGAATRKYY